MVIWAGGAYLQRYRLRWRSCNCIKDVIEAAKANDYEAIIIADHGDADHGLNKEHQTLLTL